MPVYEDPEVDEWMRSFWSDVRKAGLAVVAVEVAFLGRLLILGHGHLASGSCRLALIPGIGLMAFGLIRSFVGPRWWTRGSADPVKD